MTAPSGNPAAGALRRALPALSILLLALLPHLPALPGTFIVDDWQIVAENPLVTGHDIRGILTSDYWGPGRNTGLYRPLTMLSFATNHAVFGPSALSYRIVNLLLHGAVAVAFSLLAGSIGLPPAGAWLAGALFAVHPIHLEAVITIVGRSELLAALGGILFLLLARAPSAAKRALGVAALGAALLAKENAVVFPALLVVFDLFGGEPVPALLRRRWRTYVAVALLLGGWALLRVWVRGMNNAALPPVDPYDNPLSTLAALPRVLTALKIQGIYLLRHLAPLDLQGHYGPSSMRPIRSLLTPSGIAVAAAVAPAVLLAMRLWRRRSPAALGAALWVLGFSVTANLLFVHYVLMADRFAYLPSAGFCLAAGALVAGRSVARLPKAVRASLGIGWVAALALITLARAPDWENPERLWVRTIERDPRNGHAWVYLGDVRGRAGDFARAEEAYRTACDIAPDFRAAWEQLGYILTVQGRPGEALDVYRKAFATLGRDLPSMRIAAARAFLLLGRPDAALAELREVTPGDVGEQTWREIETEALGVLGRKGR